MATPPPIAIDILSMPDTFVIMIVALVVFGPRRLPQIGRQIGKLMYEFRKASNDFKFQMEEELRNAEEADRRKKEEEERKRALAAAPPLPQLESPAPQIEAVAAPAPEPGSAMPESGTAASELAPEAGPEVAAAALRTEETPAPPAEAADVAASELISEPTTPRILPPSTGEKVAAERPDAKSRQGELFAAPPDESGKAPESIIGETERSESAAHHG